MLRALDGQGENARGTAYLPGSTIHSGSVILYL